MKPYKVHKVKTHSPEWFAFRQGARLGCSEIRTVMYADDYSDAIMLYYKKLGLKTDSWDNEAMLHGRELEAHVAKMWQYWDGTLDEWQRKNYINNFNNKKIIRRCKQINGIIQNPKYPYLFGNVDRLINIEGGFNLLTGEPLEKEGILEIKTIENWAADKWQSGIDPSYLTQLYGYLMIFELDYGEIAVLKNGRYLDVFSFERNESTIELIDERVTWFIEHHVIPALPFAKQYKQGLATGDKVMENEAMKAIQELEPPTSDKSVYESFVKEKYLNKEISIQGDDKMFTFAKIDKKLAFMKGYIEDLKQANKNKILQFIDHTQASVIDFDGRGTLKFSTHKGRELPQLGNNIKTDINKTYLERSILDLVG